MGWLATSVVGVVSPARVDRQPVRGRQVGVGLKGDGLVQVVRADVLVHLFWGQRLPVLQQRDGVQWWLHNQPMQHPTSSKPKSQSRGVL